MKKIAIIGFGYVGKAFYNMIKGRFNIDIIDPFFKSKKYKIKNKIDKTHYDLAVVCVPTPMDKSRGFPYFCNTSVVEDVVAKIRADLIMIKSTVVPGTTDKLKSKYKKRIVMSPEFVGEGSYYLPPDKDFSKKMEKTPFLIVGGSKTDVELVFDLLVPILGPLKNYRRLTTKEAEMVKYWENISLGMRVVLANEMRESCKAMGVDYYNVRDAWSLDPRQEKFHSIVFAGKEGFGGKCLLPNEKIFTFDGKKSIKNIKKGDDVLTHNGKFKKVLKVFKRKINEKILNIKTQTGELQLTKEHSIYAFKTNRKYYSNNKLSNFKGNINDIKFDWIKAKDLNIGDYVQLPRLNLKDFNYLEINNKINKLLGVYLAEGHIDKKNNRISLCLNTTTKNKIADEIKKILKLFFKVKNIEDIIKGKSRVLRFTDKRLSDYLSYHAGKFSENKQLSNQFLYQENYGLRVLLKYYFLCDGSFSENKITFSTVSEKLFYHLQLILLRLGIIWSFFVKEKYTKKGINHKKSYYIRIRNRKDIERFLNFIYLYFLKEKLPKLKNYKLTAFIKDRNFVLPIKKIEEKNYNGFVYNLEIEDDNSYVSDIGSIHNCLPKDLNAFYRACLDNNYNPQLLRGVLLSNNDIRKKYGLPTDYETDD